MGEVADFLFKVTPLVLGVCAFFIAPAAERLKKANKDVEVVQGQTVDLTDVRVQALQQDLEQQEEIYRLKTLLIRNGIDPERKDNGDGKRNDDAGAGADPA